MAGAIANRLMRRITQEIERRSELFDHAAGGSVQLTIQLDDAGTVKSFKTSIQMQSNGVISK